MSNEFIIYSVPGISYILIFLYVEQQQWRGVEEVFARNILVNRGVM